MSWNRLKLHWDKQTVLTQVSVVGVTAGVLMGLGTRYALPRVSGGRVATMIGFSYFLFGIFVAFAIDSCRTRLAKVDDLLKVDEANLLSLFVLSRSFGPDEHSRVLAMIDRHVVDQIDYRLTDFYRSTSSFLELFEHLRALQSTSVAQEIAYAKAMDLMVETSANRKQVIAAVGNQMSPAEWASIYLLLIIQVVLLGSFLGGYGFGAVVAGLLTTVLFVITLILWHLDRFRWQENAWIWSPLHQLFLDLGLLPYYPAIVFETARAKPHGVVRVATYPHPYPDMRDKSIEVREFVQHDV